MRVRYRIIHSRFSRSEYRNVVEDVRSREGFFVGNDPTSDILAAAETPRDVLAVDEGETELQYVRRMVVNEELKLEDLVDVGNGWETVGDCWLLADEVEAKRRTRWRVHAMVVAGITAAVIGSCVFFPV